MSTLNFIAVAPLPVADLDPICAKKHFPNENSRIYVAIPEIVIPAAAKRRAGIHNPLTQRVSPLAGMTVIAGIWQITTHSPPLQ
jgi:hypothetical protein